MVDVQGLQGRVEILAGAGAGFACVAYALLLLTRRDRTDFHARLGRFLAVLGIASAARAGWWGWHSAGLGRLTTLANALFPLVLGLFFEALLRRSLHLAAKLVLLAGTIGFVIWGALRGVPESTGGLVLLGYNALIVVYLLGLTWSTYCREPTGPLRSLYGAALIVCLVALPLMAADGMYVAGMQVPRVRVIATLLILYYVGASVETAGEWRLRERTAHLARVVIGATGIASLVAIADPALAVADLALIAGTLVGVALAIEPFRHHARSNRAASDELLTERLAGLPGQRSALIAALASWPEIERVEDLTVGRLGLETPSQVVAYLEGSGRVASRAELRGRLTVAEPDQLFVVEQLLHVMKTFDVEHLALVDPRGGLLGVRFSLATSAETYRRALPLMATLCRHAPASASA